MFTFFSEIKCFSTLKRPIQIIVPLTIAATVEKFSLVTIDSFSRIFQAKELDYLRPGWLRIKVRGGLSRWGNVPTSLPNYNSEKGLLLAAKDLTGKKAFTKSNCSVNIRNSNLFFANKKVEKLINVILTSFPTIARTNWQLKDITQIKQKSKDDVN